MWICISRSRAAYFIYDILRSYRIYMNTANDMQAQVYIYFKIKRKRI